jgi:motility/secretion related protein SprA/carbohydrate binding protein with CBM11 domain
MLFTSEGKAIAATNDVVSTLGNTVVAQVVPTPVETAGAVTTSVKPTGLSTTNTAVSQSIIDNTSTTTPAFAAIPGSTKTANTQIDIGRGNSQTANAVSNTVTARATATVRPTPVPLGKPKGLVAKPGGTKVLLAWEPVRSLTGAKVAYHVFRSETHFKQPQGDEPWPDPLNLEPIETEYYLDTKGFSSRPPESGKIYFYAVMSVDAKGNKSGFTELVKVANFSELSPPLGLEGRSGDEVVELNWTPAFSGGQAGLAGYVLFRSDKKGDQGQVLNKEPISGSGYFDEGTEALPLEMGETYFYSVIAKDNDGMFSTPTEQIGVIPFLAATIPQNLTATGRTDDMIELKWTPSTGGTYALEGYNIYRQSDVDSEPQKINKGLCTGNIYIDSKQNSLNKPILGRFYSYFVRAVDEQKLEGEPSAIARSGPKKPLAIPSTGLLSTSIPGLPPESSLTISGRKKIDISFTEVTALNVEKDEEGKPINTDRYPSITSGLTDGFNLEQELQVRLEGKVGKKITVDVDYDDTQEEQRKISIIYAGDPDEVIQEAAFGDILLDLPRTEFAGYNKNLFGAKLKIAFDEFRLTAIGAQTKGITVTEEFKGNTSPRKLDKKDIHFTAFKYYYLTKDWPNQINHPELPGYNAAAKRHGIIAGTEKIYVTNGANTAGSVTVTAQGSELRFNLLSSGVNYTVDYNRGIITFNTGIQKHWNILVAYQYEDANGVVYSVGYNGTEVDFTPGNLDVPLDGRTSDSAHMIQSSDSVGNRDYRMMVMNRYSLGYQNIMDPQSDPDFVFKIFDYNGQEYTPQLPQPVDTQNAEQYYRIDPTFGIIQFTHNYPFQRGNAGEAAQFLSDVYADSRGDAYNTSGNTSLGGTDSSDSHRFNIHVEFKNLVTTFQLSHWNVIKNSEIIKKDGSKLQRNTDYYIDYDIGFITFNDPESIAASTEIIVTYEYLPFGGKFQSNLFGARAEYDLFNKKISLGTTFLYNASQSPLDIPDIRSTPTSLSLIDGDIKFALNPDDLGEWTLPWIGTFKVPLTLDVTAETAFSTYQTNTYRKAGEDGVAMVDSMEGSDNILSLPPDNNAWFPSSKPISPIPIAQNPPSYNDVNKRIFIYQTDAFEPGHAAVDGNDKTHQLRWYYNGLSSDTWDGFMYPISSSGTNLHEYKHIEMDIYCPPGADTVVLNIDLGLVSEDSNGNGILNFEGDGHTLGSGDDVGIGNIYDNKYLVPPSVKADPDGPKGFFPEGAPGGYWGDGNNRLNTEDLNGDGELGETTSYYQYTVNLDKTGWNAIQIPLAKFVTPTQSSTGTAPTTNTQDLKFLESVKHMRMWITSSSNTPSSNYIQFESIRITGNKWEPKGLDVNGNATIEPSANTITVSSVSLETDASYVPNTNFYIYDENQEEEELQNERSLQFKYNGLDSNSVVVPGTNTMPAFFVTRSLTTSTTGYDYTGYRYLRLDVYKARVNNPNQKMFLRLALDANNFYHYEFDLEEAPHGAWHTYIVELDGSDGKRTDYFTSNILSGLSKIKEMSIGIINPGVDADNREDAEDAKEIIWVNNIRVSGGESKEGMAYRISSNTRLSDIFTVSTDLRDVDSDFYTIDETPSGKQHTTSSSVKGNITKINWLPMSGTWSRIVNFTEPEYRPDPSYSNNFATPDVVTESVSGDMAYNQLPGLDISCNAVRTRKATIYLNQWNNVNHLQETIQASPRLSYSLPSEIFGFKLGTTTLTGKYAYTDTHTMYDQEAATLLAPNELTRGNRWLDNWKHTKLETYSYQGSYSPIQYISLSPSFTYTQNSDRGYLSSYRFYAALDTTQNPDNKHYFSDMYRMSRLDKIAKINLNFMNVPVLTPSFSYSMTNTRDYINDTLSVPGSLSAQTGFALGDLIGWNKFPKFNLSQNYTTSATFKNELDEDAISGLDFQELWIIDPLTFKDKSKKFNAAYINSRSMSESISTSVGLIPNVNLTPQYSDSWTRKMTSQDNFSTTTTRSTGSGLVWSRVPSFSWFKIQSMNLDYRYTENSSFNSNDKKISNNITHNGSVTLPFRVVKDISSTLTGGIVDTIRLSGEELDVEIREETYSGGITVSYNLNMDAPIRLPGFWPFNGAVLRLQQTLRLSNSFNVEFSKIREKNVTGNKAETDTYTNDTTINYSLWKNVEGDVSVTNQWFYNKETANKDYYAIRIKAGLTAIF